MKKIITFAFLMMAFVPMNAQNYLFDGIYSGMTSEDYLAYCSEHYQSEATGYIVNFEENSYFIDPFKNSNQVIAGVILTSFYFYGSQDYNGAMLTAANKIKSTLLSLNYQQITNWWPLMGDVKYDCPIVYSFKNGNMEIFLGILRLDNDNFRLMLGIYDINYDDELGGN